MVWCGMDGDVGWAGRRDVENRRGELLEARNEHKGEGEA